MNKNEGVDSRLRITQQELIETLKNKLGESPKFLTSIY